MQSIFLCCRPNLKCLQTCRNMDQLHNKRLEKSCNTDGKTPLHIACEYGYLEILKVFLKDKKCEINVQNRDGNTPLHIACYKKSLEIVRLLLKMRCCTNIPNRKGETAQDITLNEDGDCRHVSGVM